MTEKTQTALAEEAVGETKTYEARAWAAPDARSRLAQATIRRRVPGPTDVQIDVQFCGVCHSDLHPVRD